jgi:hypothetical protein
MLLQNQGISTKEMSFPVCRGAGSPCGTLWKREKPKSRVPNGVLGRIQSTPPPRVLEEVAGEIREWGPRKRLHRLTNASSDLGYVLPINLREAIRHGDISRTAVRAGV